MSVSGTVDQLWKQCNEIGIPTTKQVDVVTEEWLGKPKGMRQVLWERGWIDETKICEYKKDMPKDEFGNDNEAFCLPSLMDKQPDFINKLTSLQHMACDLGSEVDQTPKCHPEMAGEGIEYIWAKSKQWYRQFSAEEKKGIEKYHALVKLSLAQGEGADISLKQARLFSAQARR